jgi:hypothetical protein
MNDLIDDALANDEPIRRTFLLVLIAYGVVQTWFVMLFWMVLGYIACSVFAMMAHYSMSRTIENAMIWLANPSNIFNSVADDNIPLHAFVGCIAVLYALPPVLLYINTEDLSNKTKAKAKMVRVMFGTPTLMVLIYGLYWLYRFFNAG